jgi:UDP-2-acetamido-3-amino-2,3-dideoxy-glucuronate N-acetyltransferase
MMIHPLADVQSKNIGEGTSVWQFAVILAGAVIGKNCNINCHTFIENDVVIGDNVTVKSGTFIWDSIRIENDVFIGPNVVFTNDLRPRSKQRVVYPVTTIGHGASLGANTTVLAGISIGKYAMTGIASVVTRPVPAYALVYGNPARQQGWVDEKGEKLKAVALGLWESALGIQYKETAAGLEKI